VANYLPLLKGAKFDKERQYIFAERGPHGSATFNESTTASGVDYSRCVRSTRYKLIYNVTPNLRYTPVDSAGDPSWKDIVKAHEDKTLATEFETVWFTSPRPVYELYDLKEDPSELHNLYGQNGLEETTLELKTALQKKMILDFDYLPLPIAGEAKSKGKAQAKNDPNRAEQFKRLDTDHDGKLSPGEFSAKRNSADAAAWFKARDADGNGSIDAAEYTASTVPNPPKH
jgi:hypothetical protein